MPTGYTSAIDDKDISFEQFVWRCARGMGALVMMRDDYLGAKIPERFEASPYHQDALEKAQKERKRLLAMSDDQIENENRAEMAKLAKESEEATARSKEALARYDRMVAKVEAWAPPTKDHEGLKKFMLEQLSTGRPFDMGGDYEGRRGAFKTKPAAWRRERIAAIDEQIAYHSRAYVEEVERTEERNDWLDALRGSVPPTE